MQTVEITTIKDIPMNCKDCGWIGTEADCKALTDSKDYVHGCISAECPKCGNVAIQMEDCKYSFRESMRNSKHRV